MDKDSFSFKLVFYPIVFIVLFFIAASIGSLIFVNLASLSMDEARPWTGFLYWYYYGNDPSVYRLLLISHGISTVLVVIFLAIILIPKPRSLYGDAKWAKESELKSATPSLRAKKGIILGKSNGKYLIQGGQQFTLLAAPTRSGKGVSVVIPNCLNWSESLVVTDIKLENYQITSGYRRMMGQEVFMFNPSPRDYKTHRWNPLGYIDTDRNLRIDDIQKIATFLIKDGQEGDIWAPEARDLFLGIVLYLMDEPGLPVTLGEVYRQLKSGEDTAEHFDMIIQSRRDELHPVCVMSLSSFVQTTPKTRSGIEKQLTSSLTLFANPLIDAATSENDFDLTAIRKKKMSIYVGITPDNLERLSPLLNLFYQQLVDLNTRELPDKENEPYSALLLLDEFAAMGRMTTISKGVSYIAGYNLRLLPIIQTPAQLVEIYGREGAENFIDNHATRVVFAPKKMKEAEEIANEIGYITAKSTSISKPRNLSGELGNQTVSEAKRHLLLPQEVKEIGQDNLIVISENCRPVQGKKLTYYSDDDFLTRCVPKENLKAAKACRDQETFLTLVRTPAPVPQVEVKEATLRSRKKVEFDLDFDSVPLPDTEAPLTDEQIDEAADEFMAMLQGK